MSESDRLLAPGTPASVAALLGTPPPAPITDSTLGVDVEVKGRGVPPHRLVAIGDSLTQGVQSGAIFLTDSAYPAIIADELGWSGYDRPQYAALGGLPLNIEFVLRELEREFGSKVDWWETPLALFRAASLIDRIEDYWERGPGAQHPVVNTFLHAQAVLGWDLRDALSHSAATCVAQLDRPVDQFLGSVSNASERAALRVYPSAPGQTGMTMLDVARELGEQHGEDTEAGLETLIVMLGSNNCLGTVVDLQVRWSASGHNDLVAKKRYNLWDPVHFRQELAELVARVRGIKSRHVIWATVPHVTIPPISRGVGGKVREKSRYFRYYTRFFIPDSEFDPGRDPYLTDADARAIDLAIDAYNRAIADSVHAARADGRDWHLFDLCGLLDRLAARRYLHDPSARPAWWMGPYQLPEALDQLEPSLDSRYLQVDDEGRRTQGGLFSLDGVHPTTVAYGIIAQEIITIMANAGVAFQRPDGTRRAEPITVDFARLLQRDTLVRTPPSNLNQGLGIAAWLERTVRLFERARFV